MNYEKIRAALETHLNTSSFSLPDIAWENVDYKPSTGTEFIKVQFLPTSRRPAVKGTNPRHRLQGIFRLLCHFPENQGPGNTQDLVENLIDRFDSTTDIILDGTTVRIEYTQQESSYSSSPWYITPVTVAWFSYT